ncbi:EAL domain-containing protein [Ornithinibacillus scapharcae]|uniref:bifunctional diguanylate cyclase/phosphodiesterase n=1 Tax=Ornithinibacillus scapharcae TaxID=1147159 RepID=UPI000225B2C3|nr:EAL domain-containing protein [Ornithinibacillus scapharcae]
MFHPTYSPILIVLSILIAIVTSYTTLVLVGRIFDKYRFEKMIWIIAGSVVMGTGIFSMHYIAMVAYHTSFPMTYNIYLLVFSLFCGIISSFLAFYLLYTQQLTIGRILASGFSLGLGSLILHYTALFSTHATIEIQYTSIYFTLAIVMALIFSTVAIRVFITIKSNNQISVRQTIISAIILGLSISLLHYMGMKAVQIIHHDGHVLTNTNTLTLGVILSLSSFIIILIALVTAFLDQRSLKIEKSLLEQIKKRENLYRQLVEGAPEPILVHDGEKILFVNETCLNIVKASRKDEIISKSLWEFIHPDYREIVRERFHTMREGGKIKLLEHKVIALDGSIIDIESSGIQIHYDNKDAYQLMIRDITDHKKIERALSDKQQRYQSLFEHIPDAVFSVDQKGFFQEVNPFVGKILGYSQEELLSMNVNDVIESNSMKLAIENFRSAQKGIPQNHNVEVIAKDGRIISTNITNIPIIIEGKVTGIYGIGKDMTNEIEARNRIEKLAYTDQLTGLPNRTWLYKYLHEVLMRMEDMKCNLVIMTVDFDDFKNVNDSLGHHYGDLFLQKVSSRLKSCLREHDKIARLGGDEFIIILEDVPNTEAEDMAQKIIDEMNQSIHILGHEIIVTLSIGISIQSESFTDVELAIKQADFAMYMAKEKGKNNYQFFSEDMNEKIMRRIQVHSSLQRALENGELELFYQPQVDSITEKIVGLEALLRWHAPFGSVSPAEFIPVAEHSGIIIPIGEWVIQEACRRIRTWQDHPYLHVPVSVNVSVRQLLDPNFLTTLEKIMSEEKIKPEYLEIEITESVMLDIEESAKLIKDIRELGVKVAIDDFGKGYSSLYLIANLDFDTLKIDKSFINGGIKNDRSLKILTAIIEATNNEHRIIIEGVETKEQVDIAKKFNAITQGYYYSRPLPPGEL